MGEAKKQIEERKKNLSVDDRFSALQALQASVASRMANLVPKVQLTPEQIQNIQAAEERDRSLNLVIDAEGRTIDKRTGEVVLIQSRQPTLKANIRSKKKEIKMSGMSKPIDPKEEKIAEQQEIAFMFTKNQPEIKESNANKPAAEEASSAYFDNRLR